MDDDKILKEKQLVLERLLAANPRLKLAISVNGVMNTYTRQDIRKHVEQLDEVGRKYIDQQMNFLKSMASGEIHALLADIPDED
ncbi:MAG TPA: hypothetical protein VFT53_06000 [Candidatus Saccharimonadales bacterium]|nr:hypothetical protein [Candidatus Saccharimonadales bacterium]